jgi:hypothetical protein
MQIHGQLQVFYLNVEENRGLAVFQLFLIVVSFLFFWQSNVFLVFLSTRAGEERERGKLKN